LLIDYTNIASRNESVDESRRDLEWVERTDPLPGSLALRDVRSLRVGAQSTSKTEDDDRWPPLGGHSKRERSMRDLH
jgi:hypothetical protein